MGEWSLDCLIIYYNKVTLAPSTRGKYRGEAFT